MAAACQGARGSAAVTSRLAVGMCRVYPPLRLAAASMQAVQHARHPAPILELPRQERREAVVVLVFSKPGVQRYATEAQMRGEKELRAAAVRRDAPVLAVDKVHALIEGRAAARMPFGADHEAAVRGIPLWGGGRSHRRTRQDR